MVFLLSLKSQHENRIKCMVGFDGRRHYFLYFLQICHRLDIVQTVLKWTSERLPAAVGCLSNSFVFLKVTWWCLFMKIFSFYRIPKWVLCCRKKAICGVPKTLFCCWQPTEVNNYTSLFWFADFKKVISLVRVAMVSFKQ